MSSLKSTRGMVISPCIRNCCLDDCDICLGCFRSLDEIRQWTLVDDDARLVFLQKAQQRRDSYRQRYPSLQLNRT